MSVNHDDLENRSGHASVHTNPANNQPVTSTSIHGQATGGNYGGYSTSISEQSSSGHNGDMYMANNPLGIGRGQPSQIDDKRNTMETNIDDIGNRDKSLISGSKIQTCSLASQRGSDSSSDSDTWAPPVGSVDSDVKPDQGAIPKVKLADTATNSSSQKDKLDRSVMLKGQNAPVTDQDKLDRSVNPDVKPDQGAIPKVKPAGGVFQKAWTDFHVSIKRKEDMKILEQRGCKESGILPVKMQYLLNFHFKELETALFDELLKLKWNVKSVKPGDQCLSIEVKNYTDESVLENVILLLSDEVNKVNYCQSMLASKHPELLLKEYIDRGYLAIYVDDQKVFVVGIVDNPKKVTEILMKKPTSTDYSSTSAYKVDVQLDTGNPFKCQLLIYLRFLPTLKQKHPSVNVTLNEERSIMSVFGDNHDDVQAAVDDVHLFTKDFAVINTELDPLLIQLLKLPEIKTFIKQLCEEQDLKVIWTLSEFDSSITCHGKNRKAVQGFSDVLKHNLEKKIYPYSKQSFGDKTMIFSTTNMFSDLVKKYDGICLVSTVEGNSIHICTTRVITNDLTILEVNFERTKTDIQKNLTQDENKEIHGQKSATRKEDTTEERMEVETSVVIVPMQHYELQMLKKFSFKTHLSRQIPDMEVIITDDKIILVSGTESRLNDEIKAFMSRFDFKRIKPLPPSVLKFYDNCDILKRTVDARLEKKGIVCHWYVDWNENSLNVFTLDRKSLSTAEWEISNTLKYKEYSNTDCAKELLGCSEVRSVLEKRKNELRLADIDCNEFLVVGLCDAVEEFSKVYEHTSERLTPTLPVTKQRLGVSKDLVNFYCKLKSDVWKTVWDIYKVKVEIDQNEVVVVGSEKQKVQDAVSQLQREIGKLTKEKWSCEVFCPRDIQAKLQSDIIPSLENRFQCSVSIESNTSLVNQQQLGQWVNRDKGLHLILVHGHMSEMAADVLVYPINKSSNLSRPGSSMMEKGGSIMKRDSQQKAIVEGQDIYLSSETGNLPCLMIAYLAVPEYKHGVNMQSQVIKCIHELLCSVEKAQFQSLVIPVKLWNDIPETTFLYWFVSALNKNLSQMNALKQIYLCIEDMHKSGVTLKALSNELSKNDWHEYNFEHLIENLQTSLPGKRLRPAEINISLVKGKLVDQQVDVIVNSTNRRLELGQGAVSMSILDKGGNSLLDECEKRFPNGIDFGEVVCTKPGRMKFKFICHSALPHWTPSGKCSIKILEKLVFDCLVYAELAKCKSIAFPVFGTGKLEYPWDEVAKTMIDTINKYGRMHYDTTIREVKIVLFDKDIKSIQAFETKKKQTEEVKLIPEDPEAPPAFILESRCRNVRVQVIPLSDTNCHHCEAVVKFITLGQVLKLQKDNPQSKLVTDGIVKSKYENSTFWTVNVFSDDNERSYKEAVLKILGFATEERIATLAFCLMQRTGTPLKFKVQATIIRDCIYTALQKNRYLQIVKIIVPTRDEFDLMLKDDKLEEPKGFFSRSVFSSNTPPLKRVRYSDFVEKPRLLISVLGEKKRQIDELKENLQSTIQKLVKKNGDFMNVTIRHDSEKGKQDASTKKWVRVLKQKDRMQMFQLSVEVCKQLDDAVKHNHPNVEVMEGANFFVYKLDEFSYYVNENDDPSGIFYVEGRAKPKLDIYPSLSQTIKVGESALFQCRVMGGDPPPTISWSRAGGEPMTSTIDTMENGVVMFKGVTGEEAGGYICTATNDMGSVSATATLIIQGSSNDAQPRNEGEKRMNQTYRQDSQDSKDVFDVVRGKINLSLKLEYEVRAECIKQNIKYDGDTMEVEGTLKQLTSLNQYLITRFGEKMGLLNFEQKQETLRTNTRQAPHPNQQHDDIERKIKIKLTDMEYKMLKFYCPESQVFKQKCEYENGMLIIYLGRDETEQEFKEIIQSKLTSFNSMTSFDIVVLQDTMIDDDQLHKIEQEIPPNIFCYLSKDRKTLMLKGSNYEKLSVAKNKSEFILGLQKKTNNARRNRVISTDPNYESRKNKTPENRSFHQSINNSRSSSESFSGSSRTYNSPAVKDLSYLTPEGLVVKVYVGSILHLNVDCIVNAANENLMHGGGVADVISRAAGYGFQKESDDYIQNKGPLSVTECCTTSAGNLQQYQYVIHSVGPRWYDYPYNKRACADDLQKTIVNCFKEAEIQNVSSVALPAISSGIFGVPKEVCCSQYCKAVVEYSNTCGKTTCLKEIHFMDKEPGMIQMIQAEFSLHLNMTQSASASGNTGPNPSTGTTAICSRDEKGRLSRSFSDDPDQKHRHDNPSSGNAESNTGQIAGGKFQKQYIAAKDLRINIVEEDITKMTVDIIVCPQDDLCLSKGAIAKAISKASNEWYRNAVSDMKSVKKCEVKKIKASPTSLPFKGVLHTVAPRWDKHAVKDNKTFMKELSLTIRNIVQHCSDSGTVNSVAIPVLGIGADGNQIPYVTYASILANEISKAIKSDKFSLAEIYIVTHEWSMALAIADHFDTVDSFKKVTSYKGRNRNKDEKLVKAGDKEQSKDDFQASGYRGDVKLGTTVRHGGLDDCVICMDKPTAPRKLRCGHIFCGECIGQQFKINKPVCPTCGSIQGIVTGNQPPGQINVFSNRATLPGYPQCGRIEIEYIIYGGKQGSEHPDPGRSFEGIKRTAYLPDNTKGQLIAKLLRVAFERKLVFTIGHSRTTGKQGVVTWNDIHHKTSPYSGSQFGYPDTTYFDRVIDELAAKGVTEKDLYT